MDILLIGTYTQHDAPAVLEKQELGKGIYLIPYNEILGDVAGTPLIIQMQNPSWGCLVKNRLFAVSESENAAEIVEYEVGVQEERLTAEKRQVFRCLEKHPVILKRMKKYKDFLYLITEVEI